MKSENIVFLSGGIVLFFMFVIIFLENFNTGVCDGYVNMCPIAMVSTICLIVGLFFIGIGLVYSFSNGGTN